MTEPKADPEVVEFSNAVRLSGREWIAVILFAHLVVGFAAFAWRQVEDFPLQIEYRMPHDLSNDYWLYERFAGLAAVHYHTLMLGDSVIWGEYVTRQGTLAFDLNQQTSMQRFANLGLDGAHPLALSGLIEHYAHPIRGKNVLLHCNPLWLSSSKADLQDPKVTSFNHPHLVPQFVPAIPSYHEEISPRIGALVEQRLPFSSWTSHLQLAYFEQKDIPTWTLEHPYENPLKQIAKNLPAPENKLRHLPEPWFKSGIIKQDYPWVELESSLQWPAFQRAVRILQQRENRVFVLVGPFNEHLLTAASLKKYVAIKSAIVAWLEVEGIPYMAPAALPSEEYGDASHPLANGYIRLARQLRENSAFKLWDSLP